MFRSPGPLPSIFGLHMASYIICDVAGMPIQRPLANKNRKKLYEKLMVELKTREEKLLAEPLKVWCNVFRLLYSLIFRLFS